MLKFAANVSRFAGAVAARCVRWAAPADNIDDRAGADEFMPGCEKTAWGAGSGFSGRLGESDSGDSVSNESGGRNGVDPGPELVLDVDVELEPVPF